MPAERQLSSSEKMTRSVSWKLSRIKFAIGFSFALITAMKEKKKSFFFMKKEVKAITKIVLNFSSPFEYEMPFYGPFFSCPSLILNGIEKRKNKEHFELNFKFMEILYKKVLVKTSCNVIHAQRMLTM